MVFLIWTAARKVRTLPDPRFYFFCGFGRKLQDFLLVRIIRTPRPINMHNVVLACHGAFCFDMESGFPGAVRQFQQSVFKRSVSISNAKNGSSPVSMNMSQTFNGCLRNTPAVAGDRNDADALLLYLDFIAWFPAQINQYWLRIK